MPSPAPPRALGAGTPGSGAAGPDPLCNRGDDIAACCYGGMRGATHGPWLGQDENSRELKMASYRIICPSWV
ncbi:hypothetical protein EJB05_01576, partial [Eragrostis curvula]